MTAGTRTNARVTCLRNALALLGRFQKDPWIVPFPPGVAAVAAVVATVDAGAVDTAVATRAVSWKMLPIEDVSTVLATILLSWVAVWRAAAMCYYAKAPGDNASSLA